MYFWIHKLVKMYHLNQSQWEFYGEFYGIKYYQFCWHDNEREGWSFMGYEENFITIKLIWHMKAPSTSKVYLWIHEFFKLFTTCRSYPQRIHVMLTCHANCFWHSQHRLWWDLTFCTWRFAQQYIPWLCVHTTS